ncbi:MAG: CotH kinase family protein [Crocinitomicaceae bacterium]|nr:CotH kinase family protein [Crocinitomicaceae bacterium]
MKKLLKRLIILLLILSAAAYYFGNKMSKQYGFSGFPDFVSNYFENKSLAEEFTPETVQINLSESDYQFIKDKRNEALDRGIQINIGDNYVPCELVHNGEKYEGEMRLKGHMTDHLQGEKWSYRVKSKDEFLGMYRFSLQHPGTRGYVKEWVYHELLANENVINLYYDFIQLKLNDKDLGIYAVEEHFGQHVLERNNRPKGAIIRWNPELYWEGRIDEYQGKFLNEQYEHYYSTFAEPYDKGKVLKDDELKENYIQGSVQLERFRRGELTCSEAFDIEKMASFHAIIDLVGGHHSLDWSDVKYYYNPESKKIEPVGYESFSIRETEHIAGQQIPEKFNGIESDYHARLFGDPEFFEAYIQALERIASEEYLNAFIEKVTPKLNEKLGYLAHEFAYIPFTWEPYFENIELIRHNLSLPKAVHPFLKESSDSLIVLSIGVVSDFPLEIIGLHVNEKRTFKPLNSSKLPAKERNTFTNYVDVQFENNGKKVKNLVLELKIPGSKNSFMVPVADYVGYSEQIKASDSTKRNGTISKKNNTVIIEGNLIIPKESLMTFYGIDTVLLDGDLEVLGSLSIIGIEERPVIFTQNGNNTSFTNRGVVHCENVRFIHSPTIQNYYSTATIHQCEIASTELFISGSNAEIIISSSFGQEVNKFAVLENCTAQLNEVHCTTGKYFISAKSGTVNMISSSVYNYECAGDLNYASTLNTWNSNFSNCNIVGFLSNTSKMNLIGGRIDKSDIAFNLDEQSFFPFSSTYSLYKTDYLDIEQLDNKK